jgi:uncharacterized membrane protein YoaK (UPF0700 family)
VFATAQIGNIVLMGVAIADRDVARAAPHLPSLLAFINGALASRLCGELLKRNRLNSRNARLGLDCVMLVALALFAHPSRRCPLRRRCDHRLNGWVGRNSADASRGHGTPRR